MMLALVHQGFDCVANDVADDPGKLPSPLSELAAQPIDLAFDAVETGLHAINPTFQSLFDLIESRLHPRNIIAVAPALFEDMARDHLLAFDFPLQDVGARCQMLELFAGHVARHGCFRCDARLSRLAAANLSTTLRILRGVRSATASSSCAPPARSARTDDRAIPRSRSGCSSAPRSAPRACRRPARRPQSRGFGAGIPESRRCHR